MKAIFLAAMCGLASSGIAQLLDATDAASGRLIVTQFVTAPFPHPSRAAGHHYKDQFFPAEKHYRDRTVAIFIPPGFRLDGPVDVVVHFHGWGNSVTGALQQFQLIQQFVAGGRNAVLVVPEGPREAPDSAGGQLEDAGGFARFIAELCATLAGRGGLAANVSIGRIILSGHSGGYRVMAAIVDRGGLPAQIQEVWLFDALYAGADKFLAWADQSSGRLLNIYTDGGGTKDGAQAMMKLLQDRGTKFLAAGDTAVTPAELRTNHLVFLHTDLGHNDVLSKRGTFRQFLETSCLGVRPKRQ